jgi:hypothetical protein
VTLVVSYVDRAGAPCYGPLPLPAGRVATGLGRVLARLAAEGCTDVRAWETAAEYRAWWSGRRYTGAKGR